MVFDAMSYHWLDVLKSSWFKSIWGGRADGKHTQLGHGIIQTKVMQPGEGATSEGGVARAENHGEIDVMIIFG